MYIPLIFSPGFKCVYLFFFYKLEQFSKRFIRKPFSPLRFCLNNFNITKVEENNFSESETLEYEFIETNEEKQNLASWGESVLCKFLLSVKFIHAECISLFRCLLGI